ncbi:MAG: MFS transporter [Jatrophihabitans sp.]
MVATIEQTTPGRAGRGPGRLNRGATFGLQAAILVTFFAASSMPTPLYSLYEQEWNFSSITLTVVFASYVLALLLALLTVGSLSDHLGRRPVLLAALALEIVAMAVFAAAGDVATLLAARLVQGLATGAAMGVLGAGLLELEHPNLPGRGTLVNSVAPMAGLALGGFGSSALVQWVVAPTRLGYLILLLLLVMQAVGVLLSPETVQLRAGALASLRPRAGLPHAARRALLVCAPCAVATWALGGLYLSLGPAVAHSVSGWRSQLLGGFVVLALAGSGAIAVLLVRGRHASIAMLIGTFALAAGMALTLLAIQRGSGWLFFTSTVIAGAGFGAGFSGALRTLLPLAQPHERAELLASVYILSYLAFSVPAVLAGFAVARFGLLDTTRSYSLAVLLLAAGALVGLLLQRRSAGRTQVAG